MALYTKTNRFDNLKFNSFTGFIPILFISFLLGVEINIDGYIMQKVVYWPQNKQLEIYSVLILGIWVLVTTSIIAAFLFGKKIDPSYTHLKVYPLSILKLPILEGIFAATTTACLLYGNQVSNPSIVNILIVGSLIFVVLFDILRKRIKIFNALLAVVIIFSAIILSVLSEHKFLGNELSLEIFAFVFLLGGLMKAGAAITGSLRQPNKIDSVNYSFYRFLTFGLLASLLLLIYTFRQGLLNEFILAFSSNTILIAPYLFVLMIIVWGKTILLAQLRIKHNPSKIEIILNLQLAFTTIIAYSIHWFDKSLFTSLPQSTFDVLLRIGSIALLFVATMYITLTSKKEGF